MLFNYLLQLIDLATTPSYVKTASYADLIPTITKASSDNRKYDSSRIIVDYADTVRRRYPMHTKAAVWLGLAAAKQLNEPEWIIARLQKQAAEYGITYSEPTDQAVETVRYAYTNGDRKELPIDTPIEVENAFDWLRKYANDLSPMDRAEIAHNIKSAATDLLVPLDTAYLDMLSGNGLPLTEQVDALIHDLSSRATRDQVVSDGLKKIAGIIKAGGATPPALTIAHALDRIDKYLDTPSHAPLGIAINKALYGLDHTTIKAASDSCVELITGDVYDIDTLAKISVEDLDTLPPDIVSTITPIRDHLDPAKIAMVLPTLPRPDAHMLKSALSAIGVYPLSSNPMTVGLDDDDWEYLAGLQQI